MPSLFSIPSRILSIVEGNISPREIAFGVCLGAFLGFTPLNGPMALLLAFFFFFFNINRVATLITLPFFKAAYALGAYKLADALGGYLLENCAFLEHFWRWVTHLPVVAYLDINNTLVAGGLVLAAAVSVPSYFLAKNLAILLQTKYSEKIKNSPIAKFIPGIKLMSLVGDDAGSTIKNVKARVTVNIRDRIKAAILKKKSSGAGNSFLKRINMPRVITVILALAAFHFGVGFFVSPMAGSAIVSAVNRYTPAKVTVERVNVWPLTLSFTLSDMKIYDPADVSKLIAGAKECRVRVSPAGILSRRLVLAHVSMTGAVINLEGTSEGGFNVSRLSAGKGAPGEGAASYWNALSGKKDLFGRIYGLIKKRFAARSPEEQKKDKEAAGKIVKTSAQLPKGRIVTFKAPVDQCVFEINRLDMSGARIHFTMNGEKAEISKADLRLGRIGYDPAVGMRVGMVSLRGEIDKDGSPAGRADILYSTGRDARGETAVFKIGLNEVDMNAVGFVYADSLPVIVSRGRATMRSDTSIKLGLIDSRNEITISGHSIEPRPGDLSMMGPVPVSAVCGAINRVDPLTLKFDIGGSVESPEFKNFQESLMAVIKPFIEDIKNTIKQEGMKFLQRFLDRNK